MHRTPHSAVVLLQFDFDRRRQPRRARFSAVVGSASAADAANRIRYTQDSTGRTTFTYDANGNELILQPPTGNRTTYSWTYENQLAVAALPTGSRTTQTWAPVTRSSDEYRVVQQTSATAFVKHFWDRNNIVLETNNPGTVTAEFTVVPEDYGEVVSDRRSGATSVCLMSRTGRLWPTSIRWGLRM